MAKFKSQRTTTKINLLTIPDAEIDVYDNFLAGDIEIIANEQNKATQSFLIVKQIIADWNLEDESGKKLPITIENIKKLDITDFNHIVGKVQSLKSFLDQKMSEK